MVGSSKPRMLLLGAFAIGGAALAFLLGTRAGAAVDRFDQVMTVTGEQPLTPAGAAVRGAEPGLWLDRPLAGWNTAGGSVPAAAFPAESRADVVKRCNLAAPTSSAGEQALARAGWIPFLHFDREMVRDDVEIVGGMSAATATCEPAAFNVFVFVGGRFAGALSPVAMTSRRDGAGR